MKVWRVDILITEGEHAGKWHNAYLGFEKYRAYDMYAVMAGKTRAIFESEITYWKTHQDHAMSATDAVKLAQHSREA